jgi:hypothetical protein
MTDLPPSPLARLATLGELELLERRLLALEHLTAQLGNAVLEISSRLSQLAAASVDLARVVRQVAGILPSGNGNGCPL